MNDLSMRPPRARALAGAEKTLAEQLAAWLALRIDEHALKPGTRLPSIRAFADERGVSRSTVVEAYDRLIAAGYAESRRGSGFFVRARRSISAGSPAARTAAAARTREAAPAIDVLWLLRAMLRQSPSTASQAAQPGAGLLPPEWLDDELVAGAVRAVGRSAGSALLSYGQPEGYLPLRQQLSERLAQADIAAPADQIITTTGVTQAIDLVARHFIAPGDTVFVEDPAWFLMFGRFAAFGARVVGVPRRADGPDLAVLANLLTRHQPKLFVVGSVLHNPTGSSISAATAHGLLKLAEQHGVTLIEDDVYGDLAPGRALRLAALDQLRRVVYVSSFSKTLAASLRVGYIAAAPAVAQALGDLKMLTGLTTPELTERVVTRILAEGQYRRHLDRLRGKLDAARDRTARALERLGARMPLQPEAGIFLWADFGRDTTAIAAEGSAQGVLCAPGSLFSPTQLPSTWMRVSAAASLNPGAMRFLAEAMR
ncbi:MAG: PLP-dependent aminotransferase family protein [Burkholderiaceae bacterium]|nr:PLP-dependent aminotransferase family protein [Burkholderiaceae bacterium]